VLLFIDKIFKGVAKAVEEMERQQAEQAARQLAARTAARNRRTAARQSVEKGAVAPLQLGEQHATKPLQLGEQHATKPPVAAHHVHSKIEHYGDENVFDEYVVEHHDPTDEIVNTVDLSAVQSKSSFESDRTHQIPLAPHALRILSQPSGPRDAFILNEIFRRPEHRWG
jgi:hypothetical protein